MNRDIAAEFALPRYGAGDALQFVLENGTRSRTSVEADRALPGLSKVVELQQQTSSYCGESLNDMIRDPLLVEDGMAMSTHEQWCAHTQSACALAKNAVARCLRHRRETRVRRCDEAMTRLDDEAPAACQGDCEEGCEEMVSCASTTSNSFSFASTAPLPLELHPVAVEVADMTDTAEVTEEEVEGGLEVYLTRQPSKGVDGASAWLHRCYLSCCEHARTEPNGVVRRRIVNSLRMAQSGVRNFFFDGQSADSLPSHVPHAVLSVHDAAMRRSWMTFPEALLTLREMCAVPFEVRADLRGCTVLSRQRRQFKALLEVLVRCGNTVVSLNFSRTGLRDEEVQVLCLLCRAHLRRLSALALNENRDITDKAGVWLRQLAVSLPLLRCLTLRGTSLSRGNVRSVESILNRKRL